MSNEDEEQQFNKELDSKAEAKSFIETKQVPLTQGLIDIFKASRLVLVGDRHTPGGERLRSGLVGSLPLLKAQGGVTCVAVELDSAQQAVVDELNPDDPSLEIEIAALAPVGWYKGNREFLAAAKKAGLRIICVDLIANEENFQRDNAGWQNQRDSHMFEILERMISPVDKVLVFVGCDHIHKKPVKRYADGAVVPLGMRLAEKYGENSISSIRPAHREGEDYFDGLLGFMSKTPKVSEVVTNDNPIAIVPDEGPIKGDARITATDYVAIS